ncbi:MAG: cytochrome c peroxidase [Planctomycetota bacterium]
MSDCRYFLLICLLAVTVQGNEEDLSAPKLANDNLAKDLMMTMAPEGFSTLPSSPEKNPTTKAKVNLGRRLFFDPILSRDGKVACSSCHRPENGFANSDKIAVGIHGRKGTRNVPTILNRGYGKQFSWDGRATSLEQQALLPIENPNELGNDLDSVINSLRADRSYVADFSTVFSTDKSSGPEWVTAENLGKAIAAFERVLVYGNSKVDRFRASDYTALSKEARQGMWIFESRGGCWKCHGGENLTDEEFHNTGVGFGEQNRDVGLEEYTKDPKDRFKFKTPTLRGVSLTAPYMHDGSAATLKDVVDFYNRGGSPNDPKLDSDMKPLNLTDEEVGFLVEFLKGLSQ